MLAITRRLVTYCMLPLLIIVLAITCGLDGGNHT